MSQYSFDNQAEADYYMGQPPQEEPPMCKFCDCEYPDHSCRECHIDNTQVACEKNEGLCNDCRVIQEGRL